MRIAFLTSQFPGVRMGGIGSNTLALAAALAELRLPSPAAAHDIHVFTFYLPEDLRRNLPGNITFHAVDDLAARVAAATEPAAPVLAAAAQAAGPAMHCLVQGALLADALLACHAATPFDLVEAPDYEALILPLLWRLDRESIPHPPATMTHIHSGSAINRRGNHLPTTADDRCIDVLEQAAILLADGACATTAAVARESRISFPLDRVIHTTYLPIRPAPAHELTPPPVNGPVLFIGRLEMLKGVDLLARAADSFLRDCPSATIEFVGPDTPTAPREPAGDAGAAMGSMRAWIERALHPERRRRVRFTGELPPREIAQRIRAARFLCLPSRHENFSNVAAQALALGRTAVVAAGTGLEEVMGTLETPAAGVAFANGDSTALAATLTTLWNNSVKIATLSAAARQRALTRFAPDIVAADRMALYHKIRAPQNQSGAASIETLAPLLAPLLTLAHTLAGIPLGMTALTPGQRLLALFAALTTQARSADAAYKAPPATVALYGAGRHTARLLAEKHLWESRGFYVAAIIDDHRRFINGGTYLGLPVLSPAAFLQSPDPPPVVLSSDTFEEQLWQKSAPLRAAGISVLRLYSQ